MTLTAKSWTKPLAKLATILLIALLGYLVISRLAAINWGEVLEAVAGFGAAQLLPAAGFAVLGYCACAGYDLIARHILQLPLSARRVAAKSFVGYCFSINLGAMLGGMSVRYRLYSRSGIGNGDILRLMMLGAISNWSGYGLLAGLLVWQVPAGLVTEMGLPASLPKVAGLLMMSATLAYLLFCIWRRGSHLQIRGVSIPVPSGPIAMLQIALSTLSWCCIIGVLYWLMPMGVNWAETGQAVAVGAVAGAASHVPSSLGVLEYVFVTMLESQAAETQILAAVLGFRALYYVLPFAVALLTYLGMELHLRRQNAAVESP